MVINNEVRTIKSYQREGKGWEGNKGKLRK